MRNHWAVTRDLRLVYENNFRRNLYYARLGNVGPRDSYEHLGWTACKITILHRSPSGIAVYPLHGESCTSRLSLPFQQTGEAFGKTLGARHNALFY